jgi:hypothetical protein
LLKLNSANFVGQFECGLRRSPQIVVDSQSFGGVPSMELQQSNAKNSVDLQFSAINPPLSPRAVSAPPPPSTPELNPVQDASSNDDIVQVDHRSNNATYMSLDSSDRSRRLLSDNFLSTNMPQNVPEQYTKTELESFLTLGPYLVNGSSSHPKSRMVTEWKDSNHEKAHIRTEENILHRVFHSHLQSMSTKYSKQWEFISSLQKFTFYQLHLIYFLVVITFGAFLIWVIEKDNLGITFVESIYTASSSMTCAGMSVFDITTAKAGTLAIMWFLMCLGSPVLLSLFPLLIRVAVLRNELISRSANELERKAIEINILKLKSMNRLLKIVGFYFCGVQLLIFLIFICYFGLSQNAMAVLSANGVASYVGFSAYLVVSAFNNAGYVLFSANLVPFADNVFVLMLTGLLVLLGNTMYPIALRYSIYILRRFTKSNSAHSEYSFLLLNSRECFTHLFPEMNTRVLASAILGFTVIQTVISSRFSKFSFALIRCSLYCLTTTVDCSPVSMDS